MVPSDVYSSYCLWYALRHCWGGLPLVLLQLLALLLCNKNDIAMHYHVEDLSDSDLKKRMYDTYEDSMGHIQLNDMVKKIMYIFMFIIVFRL